MSDQVQPSGAPGAIPELSNAFLAQALFSLPEPMGLKDRHSRWVFLNEAAGRVLGVDINESLGKTDYDLFPAEQAEAFREDDIRA